MTFDKDKLREECGQLMAGKTIPDCLVLVDIFLEYFFKVMSDHHDDKVDCQSDADAKMINQMMFTKLTHLKKIIEGVGFEPKDGKKLNPIIDTTIVASLVRNIYETVALFNLIFVYSKSKAEKDIIYSLWVISGLKYRQRFASSITRPENEEKLKEEENLIQTSIKFVEDSEFYKGLSSASRDKIQIKIKERDYKKLFFCE